MNDEVDKTVFLGFLILIFIGIIWWFVCFTAEMEAKQFNKFSKTQITWFDALWADYRILPDK